AAERQRGATPGGLPGRAERGRRAAAAVEPPALVRPLEPAVAEPAEQDVLAVAEDGEVDDPVPVHVERVRAVDRGQVGDGGGDGGEVDGTTGGSVVPEQRCRVNAAGEEEVGPAIAVAVEHRDAATDEIRE